MRDGLEGWSSFRVQRKKMLLCLRWIKGKHSKQFKKKLATTILESRIYHTWKARNFETIYKITIDTKIVVTHIKIEVLKE